MRRYGFWLGAVIALLAIWVTPNFLDEYWLRVVSGILMWVAMAEALNIILGLGGYPAFGNGAFMGIGAYTSAILLTTGVPFWLSLVASALVAGLTATLIGIPVLRLRGHYFAIATVGINFALLSLVENLNITGGGSGMSVPFFAGSASDLATFFFYAFAALALASVILVYIIRRSPLGYALRAIQASEEAAIVMGINTTIYKVVAWAISAALTGIAGGIYAYGELSGHDGSLVATLLGTTLGSAASLGLFVLVADNDDKAGAVVLFGSAVLLPIAGGLIGYGLSNDAHEPDADVTSGALIDISRGGQVRLAVPAMGVSFPRDGGFAIALPLIGGAL